MTGAQGPDRPRPARDPGTEGGRPPESDPLRVPRPLRWSEEGHQLELLDQTLLPAEERILILRSAEDVGEAIRSLRVRGAPIIGVAAAAGMALSFAAFARANRRVGPDAMRRELGRLSALLRATRPTGRNLGWSLERMRRAFEAAENRSAEALSSVLRQEAERIAAEEADACQRIGEAGLAVLPQEGAAILTHCNAGALATGGIGTALGPVYVAHGRGIPVRVFACETRPVLQGARLTAWELTRAGIDVTVVTDSMAASLMKAGRAAIVIVGADRVAANGDVANKIGTYSLAILAAHHGLPFYVAAPRSTFDVTLATGNEIPIEERGEEEIRYGAGMGNPAVPGAAAVWNPAFDVTPQHLVTAFLTDGGVLRPPYGESIRRLLGRVGGRLKTEER